MYLISCVHILCYIIFTFKIAIWFECVVVRYYRQAQKIIEKEERSKLKYNVIQTDSKTLPSKIPVFQRQAELFVPSQSRSSVFVGVDDIRRNGCDVIQTSVNDDEQYFVLDHDAVVRENSFNLSWFLILMWLNTGFDLDRK